jgi:hypothetical protein
VLCDALVTLCRRFLDQGELPDVGRVRPHLTGGHRALAPLAGHHHPGVHREGGREQLSGRVGMGDAAGDGPAVAHGRIGHEAHGVHEQRHARRDLGGSLERRLPGTRSDRHATVVDPQVVKLGERVAVDEVRRGEDPEVHERQQALPAASTRPSAPNSLGIASASGSDRAAW